MLEIILTLFKVGDNIQLTLNNGDIVVGTILIINTSAIAIQSYEGGKLVIKGENIGDFREIVSNYNNDIQEPKRIISVEVKTLPKKVQYELGEKLDLTEGELQIDYSDKTIECIPMQSVEYSEIDTNIAGDKDVILKYNGFDTKFTINIKPKRIVSVEVKTLPKKIQYELGDNIDLTNGELQINYSDKTIECIPMQSVECSEINTNIAGNKDVILKYNGFETKFTICIKPKNLTSNVKVLGKINLDDDRKRVKEGKKNASNHTTKTYTSFGDLKSMVKEQHEIDNLAIVPAMGFVENVKVGRGFGFISTGSGKQIFFSVNDLIEDGISEGTGVVFSLSSNYEGEKAKCIHKVHSISELLSISKKLYEKKEYRNAQEVIKHILNEYPDNFDAKELKSMLSKTVTSAYSKPYNSYSLYAEAKKYDQNKDYDKALDTYFKILQKGEREESCIKDIASIFASLYKNADNDTKKDFFKTKITKFLKEYEQKLPSTLSNLQYLENIYYAVKDYDNFVRITQILLDNDNYTQNKRKHSYLLSKRALMFYQCNELEKALDDVELALLIDKSNLGAERLKNLIENPEDNIDENDNNLEEIIKSTEIESLSIGLSPFINKILENYDEYSGVPTKIIGTDELFTEKTLRELRRIIDTAGKARAKERAKYLLTEGKLMQEIEPDKTIDLFGNGSVL